MPGRRLAFLFFIILATSCAEQKTVTSANEKSKRQNERFSKKRSDIEQLNSRCNLFKIDSSAVFEIKLCADVPYNKNPAKVIYKHEPGHVFIILTEKFSDSTKQLNQVFGFYPVHPTSTIIFRRARSYIMNNSNRTYDASVTKTLTFSEFFAVIDSSISFASRNYNLNKYNCYDYALDVFNSIAGSHPIPKHHIHFPFIAGRGGSPCSLYHDLQLMKKNGDFWSNRIEIGNLTAPQSARIPKAL